jgi:hypothetical protein
MNARNGQIALRVHRLHAAKARARDRRAVIGVPTGDDGLFLRLALQVPIVAHQPQDRVVRLRPGGDVKHLIVRLRRKLGDHFAESSMTGGCVVLKKVL